MSAGAIVKTFNHEHHDPLAAALKLPLRALESRPVATFGQTFGKLLGLIWRSLLPLSIRSWLLRKINRFVARQSQSRFRLKDDAKVRFFEPETSDKEFVTIDGIKLRCTHVWPRTGDEEHDHKTPLPVCIMRTVYSRKFDYPIARLLAERGFHVLMTDSRGHFESEGDLNLGEYEAHDAGCTMRWLSEQPWFDGRIFLFGISIGGYTTWSSLAGLLRNHHRHPLEELEDRGKTKKPIQIVAAFPLFSSSNIIKLGTWLDLDEGRPDPVMKLDLASRYATFMWNLAKPKNVLGSPTLWVILTALTWQITSERASFKRKQMHLPLTDLDISVCGEEPVPRMPMALNPSDPFWQKISYEDVAAEIGKGVPVGDVEGAEAPALFLATGWYDIFLETTMLDYKNAMAGVEEAKRQGRKGNEHIYLMVGPWTHFGVETFFGPIMRETIRVLDHVFKDIGRESHHEDSLETVARVTAYCVGAGGFFFHRMPFYKKMALLLNPNNPFNIENDSNHCWRFYDCWPPRTSRPVFFALQPRGRLRLTTASMEPLEEGTDSFTYDPADPTPTIGGAQFGITAGPQDNRVLEARPDTLVYTSPANLSRDAVEIAGSIKARVWAYSTARSADIFARLTLVDPRTGESIVLCDGLKRTTLLSEGDVWPRLFEVNLGNFCASIEPKWRFRLTIAGGSFPHFSRNLGYGEDARTATKFTKARHRIMFKELGQYSEVELPVVGGTEVAHKAFCMNPKA